MSTRRSPEGLGIVCINGDWFADEITLAECYPEDQVDVFRQLAPHMLEGPEPVIRVSQEDPEDEPR